MRRSRNRLWRFIKWSAAGGAAAVLVMLAPAAYVEVACRGDAQAQAYDPVIADPALQRREANTYLTYPEWHIVYAYDGLAKALQAGDEHAFDYLSSIVGFWRSTCALMTAADRHGGADWPTRVMIHTIGVSFTVEMGLKGAYEETIGRAAAWLRGHDKTPQDKVVADIAADYSSFLRQTPWYRYPFTRQARTLWAAPIDGFVRGWERRLGIGAEFLAKAAYAKAIGGAVAAGAPAPLVIRTIVRGIDKASLADIAEVKVIGGRAGGIEIETPRYDLYTRILDRIARQGGTIVEIAGNDDVMVTLTVPEGSTLNVPQGTAIMRLKRSGYASDRLLVDVKVKHLAALFKARPMGDPGVEHVFDY